MKCPFILAGELSKGLRTLETTGDCLKEECVWWEADLNRCCIKGITEELRLIELRLIELTRASENQ